MSEKLKMFNKTLEELKSKAETKRETWINAGPTTADEAYTDLNNTLSKIDLLVKQIDEIECPNSTNPTIEDLSKHNIITNGIKPATEQKENSFDEKFKSFENKIQLHNATEKDALEYLKIYDEIFSKYFENFGNVLQNSPVLSSAVSSTLFYKIIDAENLSESIKSEITKIRKSRKDEDNKESIFWWQRHLIVSALTVSIIKFNKFDYNKADFLIDFITDQEDKVWENALVGLCISLSYRDNKWHKFENIRNRLIALQKDERIQNGLSDIELVWRLGLYKKNLLSSNLNKNSFFENQPHNWFLPFYDKNPTLTNSLELCNDEFDAENFKKFIIDLPLLDSYKYVLCESLSKNEVYKLNPNIEKDKQIINKIHYFTKLSGFYFPYQNIMSTLFQFFNFYPKEELKDLFYKKKSLIESNLRDTILHNKQKLLIKATKNHDEGNFGLAKQELKEVLKFEENNPKALQLLAHCIENIKYKKHSLMIEGIHEALTYWDKLEITFPNNVEILKYKRNCYNNTGQYSKALEYSLKLEEFEPNNLHHKCYSGYLFAKMEMKNQFRKKVEEINFEELDTVDDFALIGTGYSLDGDLEKGVKYCLKAYELGKDKKNINENNIRNLIIYYIRLKDINIPSDIIDLVNKNYLKDSSFVSIMGIYYLQLIKNLKKADIMYSKLMELYDTNSYYFRPKLIDLRGILLWELKENKISEAKKTLINILELFVSYEKFKNFYLENYNAFLEFSDNKTLNNLLDIVKEYWENSEKKNVNKLVVNNEKDKNEQMVSF